MLAILSIQELFDMLMMTLFVGFIFKDSFMSGPSYGEMDPVEYYSRKSVKMLDGFFFAIIATAPAIIFHELGHKFVAEAFGMSAVFHAAYMWLGIGLLLKLINFGLIFFVPAFVSISGAGTYLQYALVAFAGPGINLILWIVSSMLLRMKKLDKKYIQILVMSKRINMFLFFFNMLPIPPFDGFSVFYNLFKVIF